MMLQIIGRQQIIVIMKVMILVFLPPIGMGLDRVFGMLLRMLRLLAHLRHYIGSK